MKKPSILIIIIVFNSFTKINAQGLIDASQFSTFTNTKKLKINGNAKFVKEFLCRKDTTSIENTNECRDEMFYYFDSLNRLTSFLYPSSKDSIVYTHYKDEVVMKIYAKESSESYEETVYKLNEKGNINLSLTQTPFHKRRAILTYDSENKLIKKTEYNSNEKIDDIYKFEYDLKNRPTKLIRFDEKGKTIFENTNIYNNDYLSKSIYMQRDGIFQEYLYTYDNWGNIIKKETFNRDGKLKNTIEKEFDKFNNEISYLEYYTIDTGYEYKIKGKIKITYDKFNNWIHKVTSTNNSVMITIVERKIEYYK
jgi:hypothetical protein